MTLPTIPELVPAQAEAVQPFNVALLIDNVVHQTFNVDGQGAARFLANPTFVQYNHGEASIGWTYDEATGKFVPPTVG